MEKTVKCDTIYVYVASQCFALKGWEMREVINMRLAFNLLIISIMVVCIWFVYSSVHSKAYYRRVYKWILWAALWMYVNRLLCVAMEEGYLTPTDALMTVERMVHYLLTLVIYSLYAYFIFCLVDQFHYFSLKRKLILFGPGIITVVLILTSPWTHLIFYVENGTSHAGILFFWLVIMRGAYAILATVRALAKRHLMIPIFGQSVILMAFFAVAQVVIYTILKDGTLYYSTLIVNIIIFLLTITMVEFYKDSVTGLLNKKAFRQYVETQIGKGKQKTCYMIKLKNYEYLKENCYDSIVQDVIKELSESIKEYSMLSSVYYLGEGRFSISVRRRDQFDEKVFLDRLKERFCTSFRMSGANVQLSLFVAVINLEDNKIDKKNFVKYFTACDEVRYRSNESIEIVRSDSLDLDELQHYRNIEEAIDRALVEKEFTMYYQPIVSAETGKVISAEALIRLNDRVLGFVSPEEFIPISESNGKILEISEFVIDSVFHFIQENDITEMGMEFIEMNLSVMQCMDKNLTKKLKYYIDKYNVDPRRINLEITETATNFDEKRLSEQLINLKKLGFTFSLDDYGTGYSNLVRVLEYPVDVIKLDKSIIWSAFSDHDSFVTVKNLISMFHDVRRKLVAEGVETKEQMLTLKELGCDFLQGYYYSKPVCEEDFVAFTKKFNG